MIVSSEWEVGGSSRGGCVAYPVFWVFVEGRVLSSQFCCC